MAAVKGTRNKIAAIISAPPRTGRIQNGNPALARKCAAEVEKTNAKDSRRTTKPRVQRSKGIEDLRQARVHFLRLPFLGERSVRDSIRRWLARESRSSP